MYCAAFSQVLMKLAVDVNYEIHSIGVLAALPFVHETSTLISSSLHQPHSRPLQLQRRIEELTTAAESHTLPITSPIMAAALKTWGTTSHLQSQSSSN